MRHTQLTPISTLPLHKFSVVFFSKLFKSFIPANRSIDVRIYFILWSLFNVFSPAVIMAEAYLLFLHCIRSNVLCFWFLICSDDQFDSNWLTDWDILLEKLSHLMRYNCDRGMLAYSYHKWKDKTKTIKISDWKAFNYWSLLECREYIWYGRVLKFIAFVLCDAMRALSSD